MNRLPTLANWALVAAMAYTSPSALAQEDPEITLDEIEADCRQWAETDQVPAEELEEYLQDCIRLEADSWGLAVEDSTTEDQE